MDPFAYCQDKAAPEGSGNYYAVLMQPPAARRGLLALLALERELAQVVEECSDASVAQRKLAYWHEELNRVPGAATSHPVTRALDQAAPHVLEGVAVAALLRAVHHRITHSQYRDAAELDADCRGTAGQVALACARMLAPGDSREMARCETVAVAVERVRLLRLPRRAGLPPHTGIPLELLARCGATPGEVDGGGASPALARLRQALLDEAAAAQARARETLASPRGFAATRLRIAGAELAALRRGGYAATGNGRAAMPLTLLWIAWRHRP